MLFVPRESNWPEMILSEPGVKFWVELKLNLQRPGVAILEMRRASIVLLPISAWRRWLCEDGAGVNISIELFKDNLA